MTVSPDRAPQPPAFSRIRRNHALEHATIHLLAARFPRRPLVGRSDTLGFTLYGEVTTQAVEQATLEALDRLRRGESGLALHPNCGTNLLTAGILAGGAAFLALLASRPDERLRDRLLRLPTAILAATLALIAAQPVGMILQQRVTTYADPGPLRVVAVQQLRRTPFCVHRILTAH